jgi:ankyrin repeat protein
MSLFMLLALVRSDASLESLQALMDREDFDINFREVQFGDTPLITAIRKRREDVALELVERGANVELANFLGQTPLLLACSYYNLQSAAHALVRAGADINRAGIWAPLVLAAREGHLLMVRAMLSWGADPNGMGTNQKTARDVANRESHGHGGIVHLLDASGSIMVVRSAEQVHRLSKRSALKFLPKELIRMVGSMLM